MSKNVKSRTGLQRTFSGAKPIPEPRPTIPGSNAMFERAALFLQAFADEDLPILLGGQPTHALIVGCPVDLDQPLQFRMEDGQDESGAPTRQLEFVYIEFFAISNEPDASFPRRDTITIKPYGDGITIETCMPRYRTLDGKTFMATIKDDHNNRMGVCDAYTTQIFHLTREILEAVVDGMRRIQEHRDPRGDVHAGLTPGAFADALQERIEKSFDLDSLNEAQQRVVITPDPLALKK